MKGIPFGRGLSLLAELRDRPGLLWRELLWRWLVGGLLLVLGSYEAWRIWVAAQPALEATGVRGLTSGNFAADPMQALTAFSRALNIFKPAVERAIRGLLPLGVFCWIAAFAIGRAGVLLRYDARLRCSRWSLAGCESLRLGLIAGASLLWTGLLHAAAALTLRGNAPSGLLYAVLVVVFSGVTLGAWMWLGRALELATVLILIEPIAPGAALRQAIGGGDARLAEGVRWVRRAASSARRLLLLAAVAVSFLPAPFSGAWPLIGWWVLLSLILMAAAGAVRLAVLLALLGVVREARAPAMVRSGGRFEP